MSDHHCRHHLHQNVDVPRVRPSGPEQGIRDQRLESLGIVCERHHEQEVRQHVAQFAHILAFLSRPDPLLRWRLLSAVVLRVQKFVSRPEVQTKQIRCEKS